MKCKVNQEACIGCGMCIDICPEVFKYNDDGLSSSIETEIPAEFESKVKESAETCPTSAIEEVSE